MVWLLNAFLDQRCAESQKIRQKYPDRIPVIVQKVENSNIEKIDKRKYLVSHKIQTEKAVVNPRYPVYPVPEQETSR